MKGFKLPALIHLKEQARSFRLLYTISGQKLFMLELEICAIDKT
ncbi:hypothetical protein MY9_3121 [Bacillus sp. JS]|nr:hypothetical protein MY9_3121 [Bacillus sp. JS]